MPVDSDKDPGHTARRLAYISAQAVVEGQDTWAAVLEIVSPIEKLGWHVDLFYPTYADGSQPGVFSRLINIIRVQWRLARGLGDYDALYVRVHPLAWPIAARARQKGIPVIQECNGSWDDAFMAWPGMRRFRRVVIALQRAQYESADAIIAVSDSLAQWVQRVSGREDVVVSPNGANDKDFRPGVEALPGLPDSYIAFFGQFAPWQGIEVLLAAAEHSVWPDGVSLVLAGDGTLRHAVEKAVARNPRVSYVGVLPYAEVPRLVANALATTVLTYAPDRAGYSPLKLYESMSCGTPVICSDTVGQAEFVRAEGAGIVVPSDDSAAVAQAAARMAADPVAARGMGNRGRRAVEERYSWDVRARQRMEVIERAIVLNRA